MKSLKLTFIILSIISSAYAQTNPIREQRMAAFISYFNAGKADSVYTLFADSVRTKMPLATLSAALPQLKGLMGSLTGSEYVGIHQGANVFIATSEKPGLVLQIIFNQSNQVIGFYTMADQRELPGSVTIKTGSAIIKGTLSVPNGVTPVPVVLLIAGSGPTDRNGNSQLLNGKSDYFLQISDSLKLKNIAVLRYDKRGVGQSTTTKAINDVVFDDMIDDAVALIKMLKADKRFSKIVVAGHSEGSLIGMLACERENANAFISLAGLGASADMALKTQLKGVMSTVDYANALSIIDSVKTGNFTRQKLNPGLNAMFNSTVQPYLYSWMKLDPRQAISKLTVPVLIIQGTNDIQVGVNDAKALKKANPKAQLKLVPEMSHVLKVGPADRQQNIATYTMPDLPLHPQLVPAMDQFIKSLN